jgi:AbrB family looped-hinge helix DNA binding protein
MRSLCLDELFAGAVSVGERGQVVIPATVRSEFGIRPGEKLLVFKHPMKIGVMLVRVDALEEFTDFAAESLAGHPRITKQTPKGRKARRD